MVESEITAPIGDFNSFKVRHVSLQTTDESRKTAPYPPESDCQLCGAQVDVQRSGLLLIRPQTVPQQLVELPTHEKPTISGTFHHTNFTLTK